MVLLYGETVVSETWVVEEALASVFLRVYLPIRGQAVYQSATEKTTLTPGFLYCFPTNIPYCLQQDPSVPFEVFYLHLEIAPLTLNQLLTLPITQDSFLDKLLQAFRSYCKHYKNNPADPFSQRLFLPLLDYLQTLQVLCINNGQIEQSIEYIITHLHEPLSIESLSQAVGYHPQYYIRTFRKVQGITPHQFIIAYRMKRAFYHLTTGKTVGETALLVGFAESKNFSRAFGQYFGVKPSMIAKHLHGTQNVQL